MNDSSSVFPRWLHRNLPSKSPQFMTKILKKHNLSTVCEEAKCPNRSECFAKKTATFLALGSYCTRTCGFCGIKHSTTPPLPDPDEPEKIAKCCKMLSLSHVVITMVTRDDLFDHGSSHLAKIIRKIKPLPTKIEVLTSDFQGCIQALNTVLEAKPHIFNHNIETIERLTKTIRSHAQYNRSLSILQHASRSSSFQGLVKSGLMVGFGETEQEVKKTLKDLYSVGCDIVTIGQYLPPHRSKIKVQAFIPPHIFKEYEAYGHSIGIRHMSCGPFVRSSYNAQQILSSL